MRALLFFFALALASCSSSATGGSSGGGGGGGGGGTAIDSASVCDRLVNECKDTSTPSVDDCKKQYAVFRVSQACKDGLASATCEDLKSPTSPLSKTCFPACDSAGAQTCNGDGTITVCGAVNGGNATIVVDCAALCTANSATFSGTCGKSAGGQTSDKDKCWCK
jgi:hypothetical protein